MVVETFSDHPVKLTEGSYHNVKITTPEDLVVGTCDFTEYSLGQPEVTPIPVSGD